MINLQGKLNFSGWLIYTEPEKGSGRGSGEKK